MTNAQILDLIMGRLGGRASPALRATAVIEMNLKIRELERGPIKPWFLEDIRAIQTTPSSDIGLPSNVIGEIEGVLPQILVNGSYTELKRVPYGKILPVALNAAAGVPEGYCLQGLTIRLAPLPDTVYTIVFPLLKRTDEIADNSAALDNFWLIEFPTYMVLEVAYTLASTHLQAADLIQKLAQPLSNARAGFERECLGREHTNMSYLLSDEEE